MNINEKIRRIRESKEWSQEQMAEKLNMSLNGYAKIERGETKLYLDKLEQIAQILDIDVVELIQSGEKNICFQIESPLGSVYQGVGESSLLIEIERLKLALSHANEKENLLNRLLEQKDNEINALKDLLQIVNLK
ncbi:helix-turn-helix transcriptional regulator [Glaesserella parasuis]|uniref:Predicted transcriptional regulator n=1 Tax=uncultured Avibacterium sp. TaxID=1936169 RepID=A0A486XA60_9PAST|nr:helix-turn-helix transcriptional regulator [Glaesserella parasuis]MCT8823018.1 helix-turn-helix domain-containing protein [Glaesserella parasuis]MDG6230911.1 helix-turn-helix transcriptional regulator [Glaesserella parasuis]MWQ14821.1 helix-turn-helix domain-containing protein [Glaesserella parasuis]VGM95229.1 Predicted transcriptional regulator [uncultured Avibacterium sp.]